MRLASGLVVANVLIHMWRRDHSTTNQGATAFRHSDIELNFDLIRQMPGMLPCAFCRGDRRRKCFKCPGFSHINTIIKEEFRKWAMQTCERYRPSFG